MFRYATRNIIRSPSPSRNWPLDCGTQYPDLTPAQRGWKGAAGIATASIDELAGAAQSTWNRYTTSVSVWKKPTTGAGSPAGGGHWPSKSAGARPLTSLVKTSAQIGGDAGCPASIRVRSNAQILRAISRATRDALTNMLYVA